MSRPVPDALLERYLAGDLPEQQKTALEARLTQADRARLDELRADSAAYLVKHPPGPVVAKLEAKPRMRWWGAVLAPLAAAAAALLFVLQRPVEDEIGVKGDVAVGVYRQAEGGQGEKIESGATLHPGDRVRFEVRAPKEGWVAVISKDGAGHVSVYYPYEGAAAARYSPNEALLPGAVGLDETKGKEEVWVLYSPRPFVLSTYVDLLQSGGSLGFSMHVTTSRFVWEKE